MVVDQPGGSLAASASALVAAAVAPYDRRTEEQGAWRWEEAAFVVENQEKEHGVGPCLRWEAFVVEVLPPSFEGGGGGGAEQKDGMHH